MSILEYINIPLSGRVKQRIAIKEIIEELSPNTSDKKIIEGEIASIHLVGVLDVDTIKVLPYEDDNYHYETIYVLEVKLKSNKHFALVNEKLQNVFPNPLIIVYNYREEYLISMATKRINKLNESKSVVESIYNCSWFKIENQDNKFLKNLDFLKIVGSNLKDFYDHYINIVYAERLIDLIGYYPKSLPKSNIKPIINDLENEKRVINSNKELMNKANTMSKRIEYHTVIKISEEKIKNIIVKLKEDFLNE